MGDHSRQILRSNREYFNSPRMDKDEVRRGRRSLHYGGSSSVSQNERPNSAVVTIMSRPTVILSKRKDEPSAADNVEKKSKTKLHSDHSSQEPTPVANDTPNFSTPSPGRPAISLLSSALRSDKMRKAHGFAAFANSVEHSMGLMKAAVRLLSDAMDFTDVVADYLSTTNTNFTVIGIIGSQSSGKSTLLSMIAGNDHLDMYRHVIFVQKLHYAFRPASREAVETCRFQSQKINIYVTKSRLILLDCQSISSVSILTYLISTSMDANRSSNSKISEFCRDFPAMTGEIESLCLTAFLLQVCHTIILSVDWFIDIDLIRHVRTAEMLRVTTTHYTPDVVKYKPNRKINLVVVHQRAKSEDFTPGTVRSRIRILECLFKESQLNVKSGISLGSLGFRPYDVIMHGVNYILLSEMKPRLKSEGGGAPVNDTGPLLTVVEYESVIHQLRIRLLSLPKEPFVIGNQPFSEIQWYYF
ncbi:unnamed protein product [Thelazia callipaeda]|uniref:Protein SMG9 n=1 Tax=Thelazia callipaeda TaxID=103827 RepID=A0A0N5CQA2_THECL|nr:unnamed protein product [Thelazia callipaeda]